MTTIITLDIERAAKRLDKRLVVKPGTRITDSAGELARQLGVKIVEQGSRAQPSPATPPATDPSRPASTATPSVSETRFGAGHVPGGSLSLDRSGERLTAAMARRQGRARPSVSGPTPPPLGVALGRIIGSTEVRSAADKGLRIVRVSASAYLTRAARHLAEELGVVLYADPALGVVGAPDGIGEVVNALESGGAITRRGAGVSHGTGIPIGDDHLSGTLAEPE